MLPRVNTFPATDDYLQANTDKATSHDQMVHDTDLS
jgi:hypothetical protein